MRPLSPIACALLLAPLLACSDNSTKSGGGDPGPAPGGPCTTTADCIDGEICVAGVCDAPDPTPIVLTPRIVARPSALEFGAVQVGTTATLEVELANEGDAALELRSVELADAESSELSIELLVPLPTSLEPEGTVTVTVTYTPEDPGADESSLLIVSDDPENPLLRVPVSSEDKGEAIAAVVADLDVAAEEAGSELGEVTEVAAIEIGDVPVGERVEHTVYIVNNGSGNRPLTVREIARDPLIGGRTELRIQPVPSSEMPLFLPRFLPETRDLPGAVIEVTVIFDAAVEGPIEGESVVIASSDTTRPLHFLPINARAVAPRVLVQPTPIVVAPTFIGGAVAEPFNVINDGSRPVQIQSIRIAQEDGGPFSLWVSPLINFPLQLDPGQGLTGNVNFSPAASGDVQANLVVTTDYAADPEINTLIQATGNTPPAIEARPRPVDFGFVRVGGFGETALQVGNVGGSPLTVSAIEWVGDPGPFSFAPDTLPVMLPEQFFALTLRMEPQAGGPHEATLRLTSDDPAARQIDVPIQGIGGGPELGVTPNPLNFGLQFIGAPVTQALRVSNGGLAPLNVTAIRWQDGGPPDFKLEGLPAPPFALNGGDGLAGSIIYTPPQGHRAATLVFEHDQADQDPVTVRIEGTGAGCPPGTGNFDGNPNDCEYTCPVWPAQPETCNGVDDDCNAIIDDGADQDDWEPNDTCGGHDFGRLGIDPGNGINGSFEVFPSLSPGNDEDWFTMSIGDPWTCSFIGAAAGLNLAVVIELAEVPVGHSYELCVRSSCGGSDIGCFVATSDNPVQIGLVVETAGINPLLCFPSLFAPFATLRTRVRRLVGGSTCEAYHLSYRLSAVSP